MMHRLFLWHRRHRLLTAFLSGAYFVSTVLLHEEVSMAADWARITLGIGTYHMIITLIGVSAILAITGRLYRAIVREGSRRGPILFYWGLTVTLAALSYNTLMVTNIEAIHFPQYAFLALAVFSLAGSYGETVTILTALGALDEAYQYFVFKNWTYYDFNDVILNLIGAALGVVVVWTVLQEEPAVTGHRPDGLPDLLKSPVYRTGAALVGTSLAFYASGLIGAYPGADSSHALFLLNKKGPAADFWVNLKWGKTYHIVTPAQGLVLSLILLACYACMDLVPTADRGAQGRRGNSDSLT